MAIPHKPFECQKEDRKKLPNTFRKNVWHGLMIWLNVNLQFSIIHKSLSHHFISITHTHTAMCYFLLVRTPMNDSIHRSAFNLFFFSLFFRFSFPFLMCLCILLLHIYVIMVCTRSCVCVSCHSLYSVGETNVVAS